MGALRRLRQDDLDVEANLGYLVRSRPAKAIQARDAGVCCRLENHSGGTCDKPAPMLLCVVLVTFSETRSYIAQTILKLTMQPRTSLDFLILLPRSAGIKDKHLLAQFSTLLGIEPTVSGMLGGHSTTRAAPTVPPILESLLQTHRWEPKREKEPHHLSDAPRSGAGWTGSLMVGREC